MEQNQPRACLKSKVLSFLRQTETVSIECEQVTHYKVLVLDLIWVDLKANCENS